tara:strand:+ start:155 stop:997 length:843 start_codon:yes stop_codon:yes gene_type:complete
MSKVRIGILEKTLESKLDDYFAIVPKELFEEAQEQAFQEMDADECTEDQCILMIKEILQIENAFKMDLMSEDGDTHISITWNDLNQKRVEEEYCEGCKTKELRNMIGGLVEKLVGVKDVVKEEPPKKVEPKVVEIPKKVEEHVVIDIKDIELGEIKKEYELIYSSDDVELLEGFINKYEGNEDVWWFVARIENKLEYIKNINLEEQNEVLVKKEQTKKVEEPVVVDIKDVGLDEIKKEYELIYSSDDIELLERFINKYKDNEDVWWFVARIENKIKILKN